MKLKFESFDLDFDFDFEDLDDFSVVPPPPPAPTFSLSSLAPSMHQEKKFCCLKAMVVCDQ